MASQKENVVNCQKTLPIPARTAFQCFSDATQQQFTSGVATRKQDVIRRVAEAWKGLTPEERAYWDEQARNDKVRFVRQKAAYRGEAPKKRAKKHPLAPKRPMSAFLRYSQKMRKMVKEQNPDMANTDVSRLLGEMWRDGSPEEKAPYVETELRERAIYKKDIARFRAEQAKKDAASRTSHENVQRMLNQDPSHDQEEEKRRESFEEASVAPSNSNESSEGKREYPTQAREEKGNESFEESSQVASIDERARFYETYRPDRTASVARIDSPLLHDFPVPNFDPYVYAHYSSRRNPPAIGSVTFTLSDGEYPPASRSRSNEPLRSATSAQPLPPPREFDDNQVFGPQFFSDGSRYYARYP